MLPHTSSAITSAAISARRRPAAPGTAALKPTATGLLSAWLRGRTPAEELQALAALTPADVNEALRAALRPENSAVFTIYPREKQEADQ